MGVLSSKVYLKKINNGSLEDKYYNVIPEGCDNSRSIPVQVLKKPRAGDDIKNLVFFFHGGVDQSKRDLPLFEGRFIQNVDIQETLVVSISDPTLKINKKLGATWYAGVEGFDLPSVLNQLFWDFKESIKPEKVIFTGGSVGGHPALVQAAKMKGSIAILRNPILDIREYFSGHIQRFCEYGWPGVSQEELKDHVLLDAFQEIKRSKGLNVIYIQNATDHHFWMQAAGFLYKVKGLPKEAREKFIFISSHHKDYVGHKFPPREWGEWVKAACDSERKNVVAIANGFHSLKELSQPSKGGKTVGDNYDETDFDIQRKILEMGEEGVL